MQENCRVCFSSRTEFCYRLNEFKNEVKVIEILQFISGIEIDTNEVLPQTVCSECLSQLESAADIKRKVIASEKLLRKRIKNEVQDEVENCIFVLENHKKSEKLLQEEVKNEYPDEFKDEKPCVTDQSDTEIEDNETTEIAISETIKTSNKIKKPKQKAKVAKVPDEMNFKCFLCDRVFDKVLNKNNHVRTDHKDERICRICKAKSKTAIALETHLKFHFRDHEFMCEICSKRFPFMKGLRSHMQSNHDEVDMMTCDLCGLVTKFKNNIKRHMKSVHMKLRRFQCEHCPQRQYSTQEALNLHLYRYHDVEAPVKCPDCQKGFSCDAELRAHKKRQQCSSRKYVQRVRSRGELHCQICDETFETGGKLLRHNWLRHKFGNKCEICNITFTNCTAMWRHEKVKHQGYKPFKCEFCPKTFGQKCSLISHRNTHTGEKPFSCSLCSFKSGDQPTVSKHKKKMHPDGK